MKLKDSLAATVFLSSIVRFLARKVIKYAAIAYASIFTYVATSSFTVIHLETESFLGLGTGHKVFIEASPQQIHAAINVDALQYGVIGAIYAAIWIAITIWGLRQVKLFAKNVIAERRAAKEVAA
ncbi:MAG: hypothetical protein ABIK25_07355 [Pseudomonadota bacterium]